MFSFNGFFSEKLYILIDVELIQDENITVFKDTEKLCKTNLKLSETVKMATASQKLILEGETLAEQKKDLYEDAAKVVVSKKRTYEARYCHT